MYPTPSSLHIMYATVNECVPVSTRRRVAQRPCRLDKVKNSLVTLFRDPSIKVPVRSYAKITSLFKCNKNVKYLGKRKKNKEKNNNKNL